ncbi:hypothetical protein ABZX66_30025, partial [Micromonospora aurantiaca]|uniref:hypothetical protein n=1 Tax=Micromonospora aurantiaca (nom. illeg.) TaxID=47850 RepID=UPI0033ABE1F4
MLDLADLAGTVDEASMREWGNDRTIAASVVRDILLGRHGTVDPRGVRIRGARIAGRLNLDNMKTEVWLSLDSCFLPEGISAESADLLGLQLRRCVLTSVAEPALNMPHANLRSGSLIWKCTIRATVELGGAVNMIATKVGGNLNFGSSKIYNDSGPGIGADNMRVSGSLFLRYGFEAHGRGTLGAVRLNRSRIDNVVDLSDAHLHNERGPAISADGMVADSLQIREGFTAESASASSTIRLHNAKVSTAEISKATVKNGCGPAITAEGMTVGGDLLLGGGLAAAGSGTTQALSLDHVSVGGSLFFNPSQVTNSTSPDGRVSIDGLTYPRVPLGMNLKEWLLLLRRGAGCYTPQAYQQLAAVHRAAGHESEVRAILRAQRKHQIDSHTLTGRAARLWARTTGLLLGYGYQPWRTLVGLIAVAVVSIVLCLTSPALVHTKSVFEKVCCGRRGGMTSTGETGRVARCLHAVA